MSGLVRRHRESRGLSQLALAQAVGISRQALLAIENGRSTPSVSIALAIARELEVSVETLFSTPGTAILHSRCRGARVGERVGVAQIEGRTIAFPLSRAGDAGAADGVVVGVDDDTAKIELLRPLQAIRASLVIGGCAPAMEVLGARLRRRRDDVVYRPLSTSVALDELAQGNVHVAGVHPGQLDREAFDLRDHSGLPLPSQLAVIALAHWELGLVVAPGNPHAIHALADLARADLRVVERESGSSVARLMAAFLPAAPQLVRPVARSHREVGLAVAFGAADVGITIADVARTYGLPFLALKQERFDLVCHASLLADPRLGRLLDEVQTLSFRREVQTLGYDTRSTGDRIDPPSQVDANQ